MKYYSLQYLLSTSVHIRTSALGASPGDGCCESHTETGAVIMADCASVL